MDISFFNRSKPTRERPFKIPRFIPRCKMYDIQMGATELDGTPVLELREDEEDLNVSELGDPDDPSRFSRFDYSVFAVSAAAAAAASAATATTAAADEHSPLMVAKQKVRSKKVPGLDIEALAAQAEERTQLSLSGTFVGGTSADTRKKKTSVYHGGAPVGGSGLSSPQHRHSERPRKKHSFSRSITVDDDRFAGDMDPAFDDDFVRSYPDDAPAGERRPVPSVAVNITDAKRSTSARDLLATSFEDDVPSSLDDDGAVGAADKSTEPQILLSSSPMPITAWSIDLTTNRKAVAIKYKKSTKAPINPSNPSKTAPRLSAYRRRWIHAFPETSANTPGFEMQGIKWKSLCTPACLPLTTDYFPPADELETNYQESVSTLSLSEDSPYYKASDLLFRELVSQRLAQGYQVIIRSPQSIGIEGVGGTGGGDQPFFLSIGNNFNKVILLPNNNIEIKRYFRKLKDPKPPVNYQCSMWGKYDERFSQRRMIFSHADVTMFNWSSQDNLICGHDEEVHMDDSHKYWRARFVLIPLKALPKGMKVMNLQANDALSEEEKRIAGFFKFTEVLEKAKKKPEDRGFRIQVTTVRPSAIFSGSDPEKDLVTAAGPGAFGGGGGGSGGTATAAERRKVGGNTAGKKFAKDTPLQALAQAMQDPDTGISIKDRRWHLRMYRRCMVGSDMVSWFEAFIKGVDSREEAVAFGNDAMARGLFEHVIRNHKFLDGYFFYHLRDEYVTQAKPEEFSKRWFKLGRSLTSSSTGSQDSGASASATRAAVRQFEFTRAAVIEPDPSKKSDRPEWALLHYDVIYNPTNCYHLQVHWLVATGQLVDEIIQTWARRAAQCGLLLVEAPARQSSATSSDSAFLSLCEVPLGVPPPALTDLHFKNSVDEIPKTFFEEEILKRFDFVLDIEADSAFGPGGVAQYSFLRQPIKHTQYIHRSGYALVQIMPDGRGFLWEDNKLFTRKFANHSNDALRQEFISFCGSATQLEAFYREIEETQLKAPDSSDEELDDDKIRTNSRRTLSQTPSLSQVPTASSSPAPQDDQHSITGLRPAAISTSSVGSTAPVIKPHLRLQESSTSSPASTSSPPSPMRPKLPSDGGDLQSPSPTPKSSGTPTPPAASEPRAASPSRPQQQQQQRPPHPIESPFGEGVIPSLSAIGYYLGLRGANVDPQMYQHL